MKKPTSKKPSSKKPAGAKPSLLQVIINALEDLKAQNIVTLDVTRLTDVTDTLIIASGSSSRQVRALAQHAVEEAKKQGMPSIGIEGLDGGEWVLADFGDVVLHVMQPEVREFYDLEKLWQSTESKSAPVTQAAPAAKPAAKKPAAAKKADVKTAPAPVIEFTTQSDAAKARKAPGKPKAAPSSAASPKKPAAKTTPVKAGIYAKTGTKKPAAKKPATAVKKSTTDATKPAATKKPAAAVKKPAAAAKKTAARKPRPA
jgi:ribosome-associated protein